MVNYHLSFFHFPMAKDLLFDLSLLHLKTKQITELLTETYKRLSVAVSVVKRYHISAASLWEKTDTLNFQDWKDDCHLFRIWTEVIQLRNWMLQIKMFFPKVENSVKQRQTSEDISFSLKSFFSWEKDNSNAAIDALMTLVSHRKSGKSCSQADIFGFICEREGVSGSFYLCTNNADLLNQIKQLHR